MGSLLGSLLSTLCLCICHFLAGWLVDWLAVSLPSSFSLCLPLHLQRQSLLLCDKSHRNEVFPDNKPKSTSLKPTLERTLEITETKPS